MALDLIPNRLFPFATVPSLWNDEDDWVTTQSTPSSLSIFEDEKNVYVEAALPGIDPKNIEMTYHNGYLWIRGEIKEEQKDKTRKYYRQSTQSFSYRVAVPGDVSDQTEPKATYKHGVMTVAFAKSPKALPKKIQIKAIKE